jgi:hypothetical protein
MCSLVANIEGMKFHVGAWVYRVRIAAEPIIHDGERCQGLCREARREILLSPDLLVAHRFEVLLHELAHAWIFALGSMPVDVEGWCDFVASVSAAAARDLAMNGGEEALFRLMPGESPQPMTARLCLTNNRYCAKCAGTIAGGSVVCVPGGSGLLDLSMYCEHCNHVVYWQETASQTGLPSGTIVGGATFAKGDAVRRFFEDHPETAPDLISA